jgi:hypothetical protein
MHTRNLSGGVCWSVLLWKVNVSFRHRRQLSIGGLTPVDCDVLAGRVLLNRFVSRYVVRTLQDGNIRMVTYPLQTDYTAWDSPVGDQNLPG